MAANQFPIQLPFVTGKREGRIEIRLIAVQIGADILIQITGGAPHIGAMALAIPGQSVGSLVMDGHHEDELALNVASLIADRINRCVAVLAGIHYDNIVLEEIATVEKLTLAIADEFIQAWSDNGIKICLQ